MGAGLWLSALSVKYRDFRFIVPFIVQFGVYVSPVGFSSTIIPQKWRLLYSLNPMVGVIDGFRWAILGGQAKLSQPSLAAGTLSPDQLAAAGATLYWPGLAASVIIVLGLCVTGVWYFRRTERTFADVI